MKLIIEANDFPAETGKQVSDLLEEIHGFTVWIAKQPGQEPTAILKHRGAGYRIGNTYGYSTDVATPRLVIEIDGTERNDVAPAPTAAEKPKARRVRATKQTAEPALTGPRLQNLDDLFD